MNTDKVKTHTSDGSEIGIFRISPALTKIFNIRIVTKDFSDIKYVKLFINDTKFDVKCTKCGENTYALNMFKDKKDAFPLGLCLFANMYVEIYVKGKCIDTTKYKLIVDVPDISGDEANKYANDDRGHIIKSCGHNFFYYGGYVSLIK
jgi:hypothetical protein